MNALHVGLSTCYRDREILEVLSKNTRERGKDENAEGGEKKLFKFEQRSAVRGGGKTLPVTRPAFAGAEAKRGGPNQGARAHLKGLA